MKTLYVYRKGNHLPVLIDDEDEKRLNDALGMFRNLHWNNGYAAFYNEFRKSVYLHRFIMNSFDRNMDVDHIDSNKLNNQKSNLRLCTRSQNLRNTSGHKERKVKFKGIELIRSGSWQSKVWTGSKWFCLGSYIKDEHAAIVHDYAASILHGKYYRPNFTDRTIDEVDFSQCLLFKTKEQLIEIVKILKANPDEAFRILKKWHDETQQREKNARKDWYIEDKKNNPLKYKEKTRRYYRKNKKKCNQKSKEYYLKNIDKLRLKARENYHQKKKANSKNAEKPK